MEIYLPLILDGATGTQLQQRGYQGGSCAEAWILEHPEAILDLQGRYAAAGSNILYTPTFGANRAKLAAAGLGDRVREMNLALAALTRRAAGEHTLIAGDIAPTGRFLRPFGDASFEEFVDIYTEQASALEEAGVDLFVIETTMTLPEARAALLAVRSVSRRPVFVTFTCDENGRTLTGTDVTAALLVIQGMGADAFGLNCSAGPAQMLTQLRRLQEYAQIPLIAKPNAGLPQVMDGKTVYNCPPDEFTAQLADFAAAGVGIFGGCCGTGPEHIAALHEKVPALQIAKPNPKYADMLPAATEKLPCPLPADTPVTLVLPCDDNLEDALQQAGDTAPVIGLRLESVSQLANLETAQYAAERPLCFLCEDAGLLDQALRLYQGRALYEGRLPETVLRPLSARYGLIY